jgi:hypothetical protein
MQQDLFLNIYLRLRVFRFQDKGEQAYFLCPEQGHPRPGMIPGPGWPLARTHAPHGAGKKKLSL